MGKLPTSRHAHSILMYDVVIEEGHKLLPDDAVKDGYYDYRRND